MNFEKTVKRFLDAFWDGQFPVKIEDIANNLVLVTPSGRSAQVIVCMDDTHGNSLIMKYDTGSEKGTGSLVLTVNSQESRQRQRYAAAYGIVRAIIASSDKALNQAFWDFNPKMEDPDGFEANRRALDLLMPKKYLKHYAQKYTRIGDLADLFGVSPITVRTQLQRSGLLPAR